MKTLLLCCLLLCALPVAASSKGDISKETLTLVGKKRTYYLYIPPNLGPQTSVPLLVTLHGSGRDGKSLVEKWKDLAAKEGFIVAGPDAADSRSWNVPQDGPDFLRDLVEALKAKHPINAQRVYLFGHSAGAGFALFMSLFESEYFAATAIHAGALRPEDFKVIGYAKRKTPIAILVGTDDPFFPLAAVRATRDELNKHGFNAQLTEVPKHNHWYYDRAGEFNRSLWDFLKQQQLAAEPRYEQYNFNQ
ncbi:MAG: dienelactone hydrolase family protein [Acidobacteria bacterium]|nr:dienelactone hydrolase family protein [Acidobacteriota bacterium]